MLELPLRKKLNIIDNVFFQRAAGVLVANLAVGKVVFVVVTGSSASCCVSLGTGHCPRVKLHT